MPPPSLQELLDETALNFYNSYVNADHPIVFLQKKLPLKFGIGEGHLINLQKAISPKSTFIFDQFNSVKLDVDASATRSLFPCNTTYATVTFFEELNQAVLQEALEKDQLIAEIYKQQLIPKKEKNGLLTIWIAKNLAPFLSLNDVEDRLLAEEKMPDLVIIIDRGVLAILKEHTIQNIFDLATPHQAQSFERAVIENLVGIAQKTVQQQYLKMASNATYKNCFHGYILLLELLKHQRLPEGGISPALAAIW